ncbi:MAG: hypothetical protein KDB03_20800 [Planctomycetales bacterium]|nr:hypothetical protein [Planctomycetales bacterium]
MLTTKHRWQFLAVIFAFKLGVTPANEPVLVDISPDNLRSDVQADGASQWRISSAQTSQFSVGELKFVLTARGGDGAQFVDQWWKPALDYSAAFSTDGVAIANPGSLELSIRGLSAGKHSLLTFHNTLNTESEGKLNVSVNGSMAEIVQPTHRILFDDRCATAYHEFTVATDEEVRVSIRQDSDSSHVQPILNGFAVDHGDLFRQVILPQPADRSEHAQQVPTLSWSSAQATNAAAAPIEYRVFLGTNREAVAAATPGSSEFVAEVTTSHYDLGDLLGARLQRERLGLVHAPDGSWTQTLNPMLTYYWRVDQLAPGDPQPVPGRVFSFRVRRQSYSGAEGYGRFAAGGRGGRVIEVTNLEDDGPGSLRAAVEADGPRTVVFRVGGTIQLASKLVVRNPYLTVAGETAPGDGICVRGFTFGCLGTHDVIIRHIRIRVGDEAETTMDGTGFASCDHTIIDHCSISWTIDEAVSSRSAKNITLQRCIVAEALNIANHKKYKPGTGHSFAGSISGDIGSFHHNLIVHCAGRNWSLAGGLNHAGKFAGRLDIRNNVVFNWMHRTTDGGVKQLNFVNNYYIPGPATRVFHFVKPDVGSDSDPQQYYIDGNVMEGVHDAEDNWSPTAVIVPESKQASIRLTVPFCEALVTTHSASQAYDSLMQDVGANLPRLDAVDQRLLDDVRNRRVSFSGSRGGVPGIIDTQNDSGGWPELRTGQVEMDSDRDGLPDAWELEQSLNPQNANDAQAYDVSYITHLERYHDHLLSRKLPH